MEGAFHFRFSGVILSGLLLPRKQLKTSKWNGAACWFSQYLASLGLGLAEQGLPWQLGGANLGLPEEQCKILFTQATRQARSGSNHVSWQDIQAASTSEVWPNRVQTDYYSVFPYGEHGPSQET